tara:strand:- start:267 stop:815 length:549 start_codon:yes stop_codon:yes gene_type:complete
MKNFDIVNFLKEGGLNKSTELLKEDRAPGFAERKQGGPLPTLEGIKAAYEAKNGSEVAHEDRFVDASLEDLEQVVRNLAHTADMSEEEAAEMAINHIQDMFSEAEDEDDLYEAEDGEVETGKANPNVEVIDKVLKMKSVNLKAIKDEASALALLVAVADGLDPKFKEGSVFKKAVKGFLNSI